MADERAELGVRGEALAEKHLRAQGLRVEARRYSCPAGEIDLIMRADSTYVFVEVKTRRDRDLADPQDAVNPGKQLRMARAARTYLRRIHREDAACRFDVVAIVLPVVGVPQVEHFPDAFFPAAW